MNPSEDNTYEKTRFDECTNRDFGSTTYEEVDVVSGSDCYIQGYIQGLKSADKYSDLKITVKSCYSLEDFD